MRAGRFRACANLRYVSPLKSSEVGSVVAHQNGAAMIFGLERVRGEVTTGPSLGSIRICCTMSHWYFRLVVAGLGTTLPHRRGPPYQNLCHSVLSSSPSFPSRCRSRTGLPFAFFFPLFVFSAGTSTTGTTPGPFVCMSIALASPFRSHATSVGARLASGAAPATPPVRMTGITGAVALMIALPAHCAMKESYAALMSICFLSPSNLRCTGRRYAPSVDGSDTKSKVMSSKSSWM
mmetsp:Transcript_10791/g.42129  ORF Transcript_10791/g.42129 Transcript_10791/m.42129 type:complete len:235 (+) Transcript_10791:82-786(+)